MTSDSGNGAPSPRSFAIQHQRPRESFTGCSRITDYELLGKLGEGTFGEVHKAKSRRTGSLVALKKIIMHNEKDGFPITALREIKLLKLLCHRNVLRLEDMAVEHHAKQTDKRKRPIMYMVTPYMDHDLSGLLDNPSVHFTVPQIKCYLMQLLEGLRYLHDSHILHRDMKAANLLINNRGILQIADFGLARHYDGPIPKRGGGGGEGRREYTSLVVTRWYRPPELLLNLKKYTTSIDMWGVGCVFGEMLLGKPILAGESDKHQLDIIFDLVGSPTEQTMPGWKQLPGAEAISPRPRPPSLPQRFRDHGTSAISLLKELLTLDWRKRINAIDALEHPYFKSHPYPARPDDIPRFEDSHELDHIHPIMVVIVTETMDADLLGSGISHGSSIDCLRGHRLLNIPRTAGMGPWIIGNEIDHHLETAEEVAVGLIVLISTLTFLATVEDVMIGHPERIGYHHHPEMSGYRPEMIGYYLAMTGYYLATIDCYLATIGYHSGMTGLLRVVEGGMSAMIDGMNGIAEIGNTTIAAARAKHAVEAALL
ncbi:putative cmgc cdk protein kinase protein [Eutypa lata UCREL1]|uniref:Serine/threonine-protein kinase BUR1 n=1 Tax=Eutypa lata (strain UCR-EL1) TaxID=1287681 RepID=M7SVK9_EUTLA|nr:putative cmgc cdk protein kinase protein [Eutypa lata UCREL1]